MVQPKRFLPRVGQEEGERPKRQNSGELRRRSRKVSSEEEEYTTDETSDEEEEDPNRQSTSISGRKSSKPPRRWQASEDRRLAESVKLHGEANWKAIASKVGSRNHVQCLQRWKKVLRPGLVKGQWSSKEDSVLMKLATSGYKNWGVLSNHMPGRTSKQCRERWCHHLNPTINKGAYSPEEDKIIVETQARLGNKWSQIAARLPGRTENSIKIRCKALQRKGTSGGGGGSGNCGTGRGGATRKNSVSSTSRSRASSASSAGSAQSCASAADSAADGSLADSSVADEPMPDSRDGALLPELCPTGTTPFSGVRRHAGSVVVKCEAPPAAAAAGSGSPPLPNLSAAAPGGHATAFSPPHSPFLQRRPGKGKGLQLSGNSFGSPSGGGGGDSSRIVRTPPTAPAPAAPPSPMPAAVDAGNHGRWRLWPKASAITSNNGPAAPPMRHSMSAPLWTAPAGVSTNAGTMKEEFGHQRLPAGGSFLDYVATERAASVLEIGGSGGPGGFEGASYAPMSGSSRSMSVCGALAHQSQSLQQQQQQQRQHQLQLQQQQQHQQQLQQQQQEPLSYFFESGLNSVMGQSSAAPAVPEQGQGCVVSGPAPQRIFAPGTAGLPFIGGGLAPPQVVARSSASEHAAAAAMVTAEKDDGDAAFGDFNGLGVDDLDAVVGGEDDDEDDTAAPLRSCCSFLDLPAEGMVVGDMPLSW